MLQQCVLFFFLKRIIHIEKRADVFIYGINSFKSLKNFNKRDSEQIFKKNFFQRIFLKYFFRQFIGKFIIVDSLTKLLKTNKKRIKTGWFIFFESLRQRLRKDRSPGILFSKSFFFFDWIKNNSPQSLFQETALKKKSASSSSGKIETTKSLSKRKRKDLKKNKRLKILCTRFHYQIMEFEKSI